MRENRVEAVRIRDHERGREGAGVQPPRPVEEAAAAPEGSVPPEEPEPREASEGA